MTQPDSAETEAASATVEVHGIDEEPTLTWTSTTSDEPDDPDAA